MITKTGAPLRESKAQDRILWDQWNRTRSQQDLQVLLTHLQPLISQQTMRWGGTLPASVLDTQAKVLAVEAIKSFNPAMASLGTHVTNQLQKMSRMVYTYSNAARLPEHKAISMATFSVAHEALKSELGRDPTHEELGDNLGWTKRRVTEFQRAYGRKELLTSGEFNPASFAVADVEDPVVGFVYHDMAPQTKQLFEHITGYGGKPVLSNSELMTKFKMTQGQLSYAKRLLKFSFEKALQRQ
jgi:hypothetical protein